MTSDIENDFLEKIHCNFPYQDKEKCLKLIDEAAVLSTDAMFNVIEEICRIPYSQKNNVSKTFLLDLLKVTEIKFIHPLKEMVLDVAKKMVIEQELDVDDAISKMEKIKKYPGQYSALSILYFSCDDKEGKLEPIWDNIVTSWKNNVA